MSNAGPGRNNLLRRAGSAFDKFGKMLEVAPEGEGLGTPLGKEIATVLLKVMLPNLAYCQRSTVEAFQGELQGFSDCVTVWRITAQQSGGTGWTPRPNTASD
jgi:hypothetical protein